MILSPNAADDIELKLDENTTLRSEKSVQGSRIGFVYNDNENDNEKKLYCQATLISHTDV